MQSSLRWQRTAGPDQSRALHCRDVSRCASRARRVSAAVTAEHRQLGRAADRHAAKRRAIIAKDAQISVDTGSRDVSASAELVAEVLPDLAFLYRLYAASYQQESLHQPLLHLRALYAPRRLCWLATSAEPTAAWCYGRYILASGTRSCSQRYARLLLSHSDCFDGPASLSTVRPAAKLFTAV